jgi:small multidrug resistance pump
MNLKHYRLWFYAAAVYNLVWGSVTILYPAWFFKLISMPEPTYLALWQVVGMFVLVYAPAYWWAGRFPERHPHLIVIGLAGKILGPAGFVWSVILGNLPVRFGWAILTNDLIWWPAFFLYLRDVVRGRGLVNLLRGE